MTASCVHDAHRDVIGMARVPVRPERQHGVGLHFLDDRGDTPDRVFGVDRGATTVGVSEPAVVGDTEDPERRRDLGLADHRELGRRPPLRIGRLAACRSDAHDARCRCAPRSP